MICLWTWLLLKPEHSWRHQHGVCRQRSRFAPSGPPGGAWGGSRSRWSRLSTEGVATMPKLSDSQLVVLSSACQRDGRCVYPLTLNVKGGAADKVLKSLLAKGLIEEIQAGLNDTVWRDGENGTQVTLRATDAAVAALNIESERTVPVDDVADSPKPEKKAGFTAKKPRPTAGKPAKTKKAAKTAHKKVAAKTPRATRDNTKQERLIGMLKRPKGASIDEIAAAFGWQVHTVRGAIAGALKKELGLHVTSEKDEKRGRIYHIPA